MRCTQFARTVNTIHLDNRRAVASAFTGEGSSIIFKRSSSVVVDLFQDSWLPCLLEPASPVRFKRVCSPDACAVHQRMETIGFGSQTPMQPKYSPLLMMCTSCFHGMLSCQINSSKGCHKESLIISPVSLRQIERTWGCGLQDRNRKLEFT